jgi:hypothetical protein
MAARQSEAFEAAESLMLMMISLATDGEADPSDYKAMRATILSDPKAKAAAPRFIRTCRDPSAFWAFIKSHASGPGCWDVRRTFIREQFEPLLDALERFEETPLEDLVHESARKVNAESVQADWRKALERRTRDPDGAVTAARALLESVCKTILDDGGVPYTTKDDLPALYRKVAKLLRLAPSDYSEEQFKRILGGCTSVVEGLGSVRNVAGDAHGRGRASYRPAGRHAALAVNLAGSMALFLMQTEEARYAEAHADEEDAA